jgi:hypothetical protein
MIPVNQFILGSSDPLLYPSEKMTNSAVDIMTMAIILMSMKLKKL